LKFQSTSHPKGRKKVFISKNDTRTSLTQFAYGELDPGDKIEAHRHPTMEEFFYFIEGSGFYYIDNKKFPIKSGSHINIPADTEHSLVCNENDILKFIYFGIECGKEYTEI